MTEHFPEPHTPEEVEQHLRRWERAGLWKNVDRLLPSMELQRLEDVEGNFWAQGVVGSLSWRVVMRYHLEGGLFHRRQKAMVQLEIGHTVVRIEIPQAGHLEADAQVAEAILHHHLRLLLAQAASGAEPTQ